LPDAGGSEIFVEPVLSDSFQVCSARKASRRASLARGGFAMAMSGLSELQELLIINFSDDFS
jgi:hypothetical protein